MPATAVQGNGSAEQPSFHCDAAVTTESHDLAESEMCAAAKQGDLAAVDKLVADGAPLNSRTRKGSSPLILALQGRHEAVAKLLISEGAEVNLLTNRRLTALMVAASHVPSCVASLLEANADPRLRSDSKRTAAEYAAGATNPGAVALLRSAMVAADAADAKAAHEEAAATAALHSLLASADAVVSASAASAASEMGGTGAAPFTDITSSHIGNKKNGDGRCPLCGEQVQLSQMRRIRTLVTTNADSNPYVITFPPYRLINAVPVCVF